jgi:serine/threonine protein kinase
MGNAPYQLTDREAEALTFGRYVLTRKLSQGGMAEIYLARQSGIENFEKQVVVKIVLPTLSAYDGYEEMLLNEARMAARLNHPNIVQILDLGKLDGRFFIAMEYLEGENLLSIVQQSLRAGRRLPIGFTCRVIADVLSGLEYAHSLVGSDGRRLGVIHRDISPPNVIVTYAGTTKIVDFGIAKATRAAASVVTNAGQVKGKLAYASPEQVRRQPLDARTDIFSTGVLLWELVTGRRLFRRDSDIETVRAVLDAPVPPASSFNPDCPPALDQIIARALQRSVSERHPSARAMRKELEALIREKGWSADSLTMQRGMRDLFASTRRAPAAVRSEPVIEPVIEIVPREATDGDPTTRTHKPAARDDDTVPDGVVIEITAAYESPPRGTPVPPHERARGGHRRWRVALGAAIGVALCGVGLLGWSVRRSGREGARLPSVAVATATASARAVAEIPAPMPPPQPARARVEVRVDAKATVTLDGDPIEAGVPFEVDPSTRHVVAVQRVGHHSTRTLELPRLEPGQRLVVGLWLRGSGEPQRSSVAEVRPPAAAEHDSAAAAAQPASEVVEEQVENP